MLLRACLIAIACVALTRGVVATQSDSSGRARAVYARATALDAQGNHAAALALLWEAAGLSPRDADIQNALGEALDRLGSLDAAIDAYDAALAARPDFQKAANNLVLALAKNGNGAQAVARARALVAAAPGDPERYFTLGLAQSEQDLDGSIASLRHALELAPRHVLARYNLALVLRRADRAPEAIAELRRTLDIEPRPEVHFALGVTYWRQGEIDRAVDTLREAVASRPGYAEAHYTLGAVFKAKGDQRQAAASLRRAIALQPDLSSAHYLLGLVLEALHDEPGARGELAEAQRQRAAAASEQEAMLWTASGAEKLGRNDVTGAIDCFRRATQALSTYAPAHYQLGRALLLSGQPDAAREAFAIAHKLNPSLVY